MKNNKKTRRFLKRLAQRKEIGYREAISLFYGKDFKKINKALVYSLHKTSDNDKPDIF